MVAGWLPILAFTFCLPTGGGCVSVSGWTIFLALLGLYVLVLALVARRGDEDASLKVAGPFIMWRTTLGRDLIDRIAGPRRLWKWWGDASVVVTVVTGLLTLALLLFQVVLILQQPEAVSQNAPEPVLLLGIPGVNPLIPIWYGIFALLFALVIHEGSHGILSRASDLHVKSLGLLLFIVPIGAFVEPDEEDLKRASVRDRNRVYAAGPMSNIVAAVLAGALFSGALVGSLTVAAGGAGVGVAGVVPGSPADEAGIEPGSVVTEVGNRSVDSSQAFGESLNTAQAVPGARGEAYDLDGHEDALRTPGNRSLDASLQRSLAAGLWTRPDASEPAPLVTLAPAGDGARPSCAQVRLSAAPAGDGVEVRLDRGSTRLVASFPDADWPSDWTRVGADATGGSVGLLWNGTWRGVDETRSNPHDCPGDAAGSELQAWVGAGPGGFLDGGVDEVRVLQDASRDRLAGVLDRPYQDGGEPSRNASHPARLLGGEVLALQVDEDDVNEPEVGWTRDVSGGLRHGELVGPRAGDTVNVTVVSDGEARTLAVTLSDKHAYYAEEAPDRNRESFRGAGFLGISVVSMDRVGFFRSVLAQPLDHGLGGVFFYISYPFLVFTQNLDLLNAPLNAFLTVGGPLAGLGGGFWVLANGVYWIFWINLMLGTFNALPAGPLDGGQMLRETLKSWLYRWFGVDTTELEFHDDEEGHGVDVRASDPVTQRKIDRVGRMVSRTMWTVGLGILGLILLPVMAPQLVALMP